MSEDNSQLTPLQRAALALKEMRARLDAAEQKGRETIAIVGMACRLPAGSDTPENYWQALQDGRDGVVEVPQERWELERYFDPEPGKPGKSYCRKGGFIEGVDQFDAGFFGISPLEAATIDPQHRLLLECAWHALEDAGYTDKKLKDSETGVYVGITASEYAKLLMENNHFNAYYLTSIPLYAAAARISFSLGLRGPALITDTACSSSLAATHLACQALRDHECDQAIAAGVNLTLIPEGSIILSQARMLSASGRCNTFDASADGFVRGEGCSVVVLKRISDAKRDGDPVYAEILGSAVNHDGFSSGFTVPNAIAQQAVIEKALKKAAIDRADVAYVEAHGTGTTLGDSIEVKALGEVFNETHNEQKPLLVGSVKTNLGHLESGAGVSSLIKVAMSLNKGKIPKSLHLKDPNPEIDWQSYPFIQPINTLSDYPQPDNRIAGVSSFGAGGTNAHAVLRAVEDNDAADTQDDEQATLVLSAKCPKALNQLVESWQTLLKDTGSPFGQLAQCSSYYRSHFNHRLSVVADNNESALKALNAFARQQAHDALYHFAQINKEGLHSACLFGDIQAEQLPAIADFVNQSKALKQTLTQFDEYLSGYGISLIDSLKAPHATVESKTQKLMSLLLPLAVYRQLQTQGIQFEAFMGHGTGELTSACASCVIGVESAIELLLSGSNRAQLLQQIAINPAQVIVYSSHLKAFWPAKADIVWLERWAAFDSDLTDETFETATKVITRQGINALVNLSRFNQPDSLDEVSHWLDVFALPHYCHATAWAYAKGSDIKWPQPQSSALRNSLPKYPFQRKRHWLELKPQAWLTPEEPSAPADKVKQVVAKAAELEAEPVQQPQVVEQPEPALEQPPQIIQQAVQHRPQINVGHLFEQQVQATSIAVSTVVAQQLSFMQQRRANPVQPVVTQTIEPQQALQPVQATALAPEAPPAEPELTIAATEALPESTEPDSWQILLFSGTSEKALEKAMEGAISELKQNPVLGFVEYAQKLQQNLKANHKHRAFVVCNNKASAIERLQKRQAANFGSANNDSGPAPTVAFMFPGLGEHYVDMAHGLYQTQPQFKQHFDQCCSLFEPLLGADLRELIFNKNEGETTQKPAKLDLKALLRGGGQKKDPQAQKLDLVEYAHPAIFAVAWSLARLWQDYGVEPKAMIGYSLSEYVAATLSGVLQLEEAVTLVALRAQLMTNLPKGAMLAVPLEQAQLQNIIDSDENLKGQVEIAAVSTPKLCVVAGKDDAVEHLSKELDNDNISCRKLPASYPFHTSMMEPIREEFAACFSKIQPAQGDIPYISNVSGRWCGREVTNPHYWVDHSVKTVKFSQGMSVLLAQPNQVLLEVGPGQSLGSFVYQHPDYDKQKHAAVLSTLRHAGNPADDKAFLLTSMGRLWLTGVNIQWANGKQS